MIAFEIFLNGETRLIAGHKDIVHIFANLTYTLTRNAVLSIVGNIDDRPGRSKHLGWLQQELNAGDEVTLKIIDTDSFDIPQDEIPHGYRRDLDGDLVRVCLFCGKKSEEVGKLLSSGSSKICNQCVRLCSRILDEDANTDA